MNHLPKSLAVCVLLALALVASLYAPPLPTWWTANQTRVIDAAAPPATTEDNYAPANLGQLKHVAQQAKAHFDEHLPGGAGGNITTLVTSFGGNLTAEQRKANYAPINLGQLKAVAKPFYDKLLSVGYNTKANLIARGYPASWTHDYPWPPPTTDLSGNYAPANLGQLKMAFSFSLSGFTTNPNGHINDSDGDLMDDGYELYYFGSTQMNPNGDEDEDGETNLDEFIAGTDPNVPPSEYPQYTVPYFYCYVGAYAAAYTANSNSDDPSSPTISWQLDGDTSEIQSFIIERIEGKNSTHPGVDSQVAFTGIWNEIHRASASATSWQDSGLKADISYGYRIWALLNNGAKIGPTSIAEYSVPIDLRIQADERSASKYIYGFAEFASSSQKYYLQKTIEWTNLQGGNPESGPIGIGPGSRTQTVNADTGAVTTTNTGVGSASETGNATSSTVKVGTVTIYFYNDPPNDKTDDPGTQTVTTTLSQENTEESVRLKAVNALGDFDALEDYFYTPSATFEKAGRTIYVGKFRYRLKINAVQSATIRWIERFTPVDDPTTTGINESEDYTDTPKSWTGSGEETPTYTVAATSGQQGTYSIHLLGTYVDLQFEGGSQATEDLGSQVLIVNRDNDEGKWGSPDPDQLDSSYTPDKDLSTAYYDDDLRWLHLGYSPDRYDEGSLKLEVVSGGSKIKFWDGWGKQTPLTLPKQWNLADSEYPSSSIYVEGLAASTAKGDVILRFSYTNNGTTISDEVKLTVVALNEGLVVYRNLPPAFLADLEHAGVVSDYVGALDADALNNAENWIVTESAGLKAGDDRDLNPQSTMRRIPLSRFIEDGWPGGYGPVGPRYERGFSVANLSDAKRNEIIDRVERLYARRHEIEYPFDGLPKCVVPLAGMTAWDGLIESIWKLRCDGVPEVAYELSGVDFWGAEIQGVFRYPIQNYWEAHQNLNPLLPNPNTQLSPRAQRGGFGNSNTKLVRTSFFEPKTLIQNMDLREISP